MRTTTTPPDDVLSAAPGWEGGIRRAALLLARLMLAYLFFVNLFWKLPPDFGCPPDFRFTTARPDGSLNRSSGLCDWIGVEEVWSTRERKLLDGPGPIEVPIGPLARINGAIIDNVVQPNIRVFGWVLWLTEAWVAASLFLGLLSRLGGLAALGLAIHLMIGLGGISQPFEWEWSYNQMVLLSLLMVAFAPGRFVGFDAWLRPRLAARAARGSRVGRLLLALT